MQYVANPRVSFAIVGNSTSIGPEDQRTLIVGQIVDGATAVAGTLGTDLPRTDAEINELLGATSHAAYIARAYRSVNQRTNVDVLPLADAAGSTAATSSIAFTGTATANGSLFVTVVSAENHTYQVDVSTGDTATAIVTNLMAVIAADHWMPFTSAQTTGTITFTAVNKGLHANDWLLAVKGGVPGISYTITGWANGATNPALTTLFDPIGVVRYQTVIWPASYTLSKVQQFLDARKNVENSVMDGMAISYVNQPFSTIKATALALNSSEVVLFNNEPTNTPAWKGPHVPEAPEAITAKIAAAFDLRVEPKAAISSVIATNAALDQYGGPHTHSLPLFNTPLLGSGMPLKGSGYTDDEQVELRDSGVSVIGANREWNAVITSTTVTTWLNDVAGNSDDTWKYAEWRRTHGAIREYFQRNCQKRFRQCRLTAGTAVVGYDIVDENAIRGYMQQLYVELTQLCLTVAGIAARNKFLDNLSVTLVPAQRLVKINATKVPMVSQLGEIDGTVEYTFTTN